jgi:IS1 family transposase
LNPKSCIWIFGILLHSVGVSIFTIRWRNYDVFPCHVFWLHIAYDLEPYNITVHHHLSGTARSI